MSEQPYCSQVCSSSMAGTAAVVDVWLFLEYRPAWKAKALPASDLAPETQQWLQATVDGLARRGVKARAQLVRQPELDTGQVRLMVGWDQALWEFSGRGYDFLQGLDIAAPLGAGSDLSDLPGASRLTQPRYFVCTNGQRDLCCSRFGLPIYRALRESLGDRVWQVTHLGGHRFAPNVLVQPAGLLYGRIKADSLSAFVQTVEHGDVAFPHLRGRSRYPKHVQAAEIFAGRQELGLLSVTGDAQAAEVTFADSTEQVRIRVELGDAECVLTSCGDGALSDASCYRRG